MDKNDILDYVTETPGNTNRAVLGSMLDSFSGGGGGGDSDFSTATVTYDNQAGVQFFLSNALEYDEMSVPSIDGARGIAKAILYKGKAMGAILGGTVTVTGSASYEEPILIVTGDCTIAIS